MIVFVRIKTICEHSRPRWVATLARHINAVLPLGMGQAIAESDGQRRTAACIGSLLSVVNSEVTLVPTTFERPDQIDTEIQLAEARLKRALIRKSVARRSFRLYVNSWGRDKIA